MLWLVLCPLPKLFLLLNLHWLFEYLSLLNLVHVDPLYLTWCCPNQTVRRYANLHFLLRRPHFVRVVFNEVANTHDVILINFILVISVILCYQIIVFVSFTQLRSCYYFTLDFNQIRLLTLLLFNQRWFNKPHKNRNAFVIDLRVLLEINNATVHVSSWLICIFNNLFKPFEINN